MTDNTELKSYYEYYDGQKDRHLMLEGNGDWANYEEAQRLLADKDKEIARLNDLFAIRSKAHVEHIECLKKQHENTLEIYEKELDGYRAQANEHLTIFKQWHEIALHYTQYDNPSMAFRVLIENIEALQKRNDKLVTVGVKVLTDWWPLVHAHSSRETAKAHFKELLNAIDPPDES